MARFDDLVFDIGLHKGEDTDFYLKKGYRVVAVEANPALAEFCRNRFREDIAAGRLRILEGAVAPHGCAGKIRFFVNDKVSVWGTIDQAWVARNAARGCQSTPIEVDQLDMAEIFREFGLPYFLKIDIEGADGLVLDALQHFEQRPQFISIEANTVDIPALLQDLDTLDRLGYRRFQLAAQHMIKAARVATKTIGGETVPHEFEEGASGVFGDELTGAWTDREAIAAAFSASFHEWQDIHASL